MVAFFRWAVGQYRTARRSEIARAPLVTFGRNR